MEPLVDIESKRKALGSLPTNLLSAFDGWSPNSRSIARTGDSLDQRVAVNITEKDKMKMLHEMETLLASGEKISRSGFVRNRVTQNVDIQEWAKHAENALKDIVYVNTHLDELYSERSQIEYDLELTEDEEEKTLLLGRLYGIDKKVSILKAYRTPRNVRLQSKITFKERELIVWRAQRLSLTISDYLRFVVFGYTPNSVADAHMSLEARQRFYISVLDVAENGFGQPPSLGACSKCVKLTEENLVLKQEIERLRNKL